MAEIRKVMSNQSQHLQALEQIIRDVADHLAERGTFNELTVTTKWGQQAFLPDRPRVGTTVRIDDVGEEQIGLFVHCQTNLVENWREMFPHLHFDGNRAILFDVKQRLPEEAVRVCVEQALTYHVRRK